MSDLDMNPGAGPADRQTAVDPRDTQRPPQSQTGGVLFSDERQIDPRPSAEVASDSSRPSKLRKVGFLAGGVGLLTAGVAAGVVLAQRPGNAPPAQPDGGSTEQTAVMPTPPDYCTEAYTLPSFFPTDAQQLEFYRVLDRYAQPTGETNESRDGAPTHWVAASFLPQPGVGKYALALHELPRYAELGGMGEVVIVPLDPNSLVVDAKGQATVYIPVPEHGQRAMFVDYSENRPGAAIPTTTRPFTVGGPDPEGISQPGSTGVVCDVLANEVTTLSVPVTPDLGGTDTTNELPPDSPSGPDGSLQHDGEVTAWSFAVNGGKWVRT